MSLATDPVARWMLGEDVVCGNCVLWNGHHGAHPDDPAVGSCSILGARRVDEQPCRRWFPMTELGNGLYGRKLIAS